jgi:hypothetical protein
MSTVTILSPKASDNSTVPKIILDIVSQIATHHPSNPLWTTWIKRGNNKSHIKLFFHTKNKNKQ